MFRFRIFVVNSAFFLMAAIPSQVCAADFVRDIAFPTDPSAVTYTDDFGEARAGHPHEGIDIIGPKMTPLYAAADGVVSYITIPEASWGYHLVIRDKDGYEYNYLHINNDTPGTDDGKGGIEHAFAPGIVRGAEVKRGQLVAWMGDSGNAEDIASHLHFEIRQNDIALDPYKSLLAAEDSAGKADTVLVESNVSDINTDKGLVPAAGEPPCYSGSLIKSNAFSAVYYCGADGKRYAFPNERVYFSWYTDFNDIQTLTAEELAAVPLGGNVTYRPGVRMVKVASIPNVYMVEKGGTLRWINSPSLAAELYGSNWAAKVDDISDANFVDYRIGDTLLAIGG